MESKLTKTDKLLKATDVAEILNISYRTIYNQTGRKAKKRFPIKPKRIGRLIKFDRKDIESYIDSL